MSNTKQGLVPAGRARTALRSLRVTHCSGLLRVARPDLLVRSGRAIRTLDPVAGPLYAWARAHPAVLCLADELGELSFGQLGTSTNALVRSLDEHGLGPDSLIALLARDHRGAVETMVAAGELGSRLPPMNTGFAGPQSAEAARREGLDAIVHDAYDVGSLRTVLVSGAALAAVAVPEDWKAPPGTVGRAPMGARIATIGRDERPVGEPGVTGRVFVAGDMAFGRYTAGRRREMIGSMLTCGEWCHLDAEARLFKDGREAGVPGCHRYARPLCPGPHGRFTARTGADGAPFRPNQRRVSAVSTAGPASGGPPVMTMPVSRASRYAPSERAETGSGAGSAARRTMRL